MVPVNNATALNGLSGSAAASPSLSGQNSGVVPNLGGMPSGGLPSMNLQALGSQQGIGSQPMMFGGMQLSGEAPAARGWQTAKAGSSCADVYSWDKPAIA